MRFVNKAIDERQDEIVDLKRKLEKLENTPISKNEDFQQLKKKLEDKIDEKDHLLHKLNKMNEDILKDFAEQKKLLEQEKSTVLRLRNQLEEL